MEYSKTLMFGEDYIFKEVAEWLKAIDCKSIELCSSLVRIQSSLYFWMISSKVEHFVYTERVGGSSPLSFKNDYFIFFIITIFLYFICLYLFL